MRNRSRTGGTLAGVACATLLATVPGRQAGAADAAGAAGTNAAAPAAVDEIVVTASRVETEEYRVPADVTVIPEAKLRQPGAANYQQALGGVSGVRLSARQENESSTPGLEVRGLGSNPMSGGNVLILLDGIPQRRLSFGGPYAGALPSDAITRMELVKGPAASLYGRGAMSGTLQLFTSPGTATRTFETWNSYEDVINQFRTAERLSGPLTSDGLSTFSLTGSKSAAGGWQPRTGGDRADAYLHTLSPLGARDTLELLAGYVDSFQRKAAPVLIGKDGNRLPGIGRDENLAVPGQNSGEYKEYRAGAIWERDMPESWRSRFSLAYWNADTYWKVGRPSDSPSSGTVLDRPASNRSWNEDSWFSEEQVSREYRIGRSVEGTLVGGGSLERWTYLNRYQSIWSPGSTSSRGILLDLANPVEPDPATWSYGPWSELDTRDVNYGAFLRNRMSVGRRLDVECGARYDGYERTQDDLVKDIDSSRRDNAVSPSAGIAWHLAKDAPEVSTAYAAWGKGFWPVYRNVGPGEIAEIPPESSTSYEVGLKNSLLEKRFQVNVSVYQQERNDVVGEDPVTGKPASVGDWRIRGVELALEARLPEHVVCSGTWTYREPEVTRNIETPDLEGNDIPMVARDLLTVGLAWQPPRGWFGGVEESFVGRAFADDPNAIRLDSYHLVGAQAGYKWSHVAVAVFGRNLLDEEYFSDTFLGVVNGSAFEGLPRSVGVSLSAAF